MCTIGVVAVRYVYVCCVACTGMRVQKKYGVEVKAVGIGWETGRERREKRIDMKEKKKGFGVK